MRGTSHGNHPMRKHLSLYAYIGVKNAYMNSFISTDILTTSAADLVALATHINQIYKHLSSEQLQSFALNHFLIFILWKE